MGKPRSRDISPARKMVFPYLAFGVLEKTWRGDRGPRVPTPSDNHWPVVKTWGLNLTKYCEIVSPDHNGIASMH